MNLDEFEFEPLDEQQKFDILSRIYNDPKTGLHADANRLFKHVRKYMISFKECQDFIKNQKNFQLHYQPKRDTNSFFKITADFYQQQCQIDLIDHQKFVGRRDNRGNNWILVCVDIWSRKAFLRPMKRKTALATKEAFEDILQEYKPLNVRSDSGPEFLGEFQELL
jgi:hypothetical protein